MSGIGDRAREWFGSHRGALRSMVRATLAGTLSYAVTALLGLSEGYWAVMSTLLVLQSTIGGSLQSSLDRLAGTIGGVICGGVVGWLVPGNEPLAVLLALALTLIPLTYLAAVSNRYHIAPVTAVITLILPGHLNSTPFIFALDRTIEVAIGGVIAVLVAFFVFPSHGRRMFARAAADALRTIAGSLARLTVDPAGVAVQDRAAISAMMAGIGTMVAALEDAATETRREIRLRLVDEPDPEPMLLLVRRIRNDTIMSFRAATAPFPADLAARLTPIVDTFAAEASSYLAGLAAALESDGTAPPIEPFRQALAAYGSEVQAIRAEGISRRLPVGELEALFSLGFAMEQLGNDIIALTPYARPHLPPGSSEPSPPSP